MEHPSEAYWAKKTGPGAEYRQPAAEVFAPPQNSLYATDSETGGPQDRNSAQSGDTETQTRPTKELVQFTIHIGNVQQQSEQTLMEYIGGFGTIDENVLVSDGDRRSLRLLFTTIFHRLRELQINLPQVFPQARLKIISSGEVLTRKVYIKFGVGHHKEQLKEFFSNFGAVRKIEFKFDPKTKKSRHFGYITFANQEDATRVLNLRRHSVGGKFVHCFPCKPFDIRSGPTFDESQHQPDQGFSTSEGIHQSIGLNYQELEGHTLYNASEGNLWLSSPGEGRQTTISSRAPTSDLPPYYDTGSSRLHQQRKGSEKQTLPSLNPTSINLQVSDKSKETSPTRKLQTSDRLRTRPQQSILPHQMNPQHCDDSVEHNHPQGSTLPSLACRDISRMKFEAQSYLKSRITSLIDSRHKDPSNIVFNIRHARKDSSAVPNLTMQN